MAGNFGHNRETKSQVGWNVTGPAVLPDQSPKGRVELDPFAFEALIQQNGSRIKIYRSMLCPNVQSVDAAEHDILCVVCNGSSWVDVDPLCTVGVIQSQKQDRIFGSDGQHDGNTVQITLPLGVEASYFTLIELLDFTDIFFQRVLRTPGGGDVDVLKYSACRVNVLIDRAGVRYLQDTDFRLDQNGDVLWLGAGASRPADNQIYSIHYEAAVQFRCTRALHVNRFARHTLPNGTIEHLRFPEAWQISKEFLIKRKDRDGNELKQGPYSDWNIVS